MDLNDKLDLNLLASKLNKLEKYPYQEEPCAHLPNSNTVTIFDCCNLAYNCIACHGLFDHAPKISKPSERYCKKCLKMFIVDYSTAEPVNCGDCIEL